MSRTFKDRPYRLREAEAVAAGCLFYTLRCGGQDCFSAVGDVDGYEYSRHNHRTHAPIRRYSDWRWIEGDWCTDYGAPRCEVARRLRGVCGLANGGALDADWDDPVVYQRRRRWRCGA